MNIVEKTKDSACCESPEVPHNETTTGSVQDETPEIHVVSKDDLHAETKCEQCGFTFKISCGLRSYIRKHHIISQLDVFLKPKKQGSQTNGTKTTSANISLKVREAQCNWALPKK